MSIVNWRVILSSKLKKGIVLLGILGIVEFALTIFLVISLSANVWYPQKSDAAAGVSKIIAYQGRLTDANGNPLGGAGTNYCFRFSIYDSSVVGAGSKLWPAATPTTNTVMVANGVFNVGIGEVDDLSTFNFYSNDTVYLNVDAASQVNSSCSDPGVTWETIGPRQRIDATGYARVARDVYSNLMFTDNANNKVQIGTGVGVPSSQVLLKLDVKNTDDFVGQTCSVSGALWYVSGATNRALICENGIIRAISNATTTIDGIKEVSAGSAIAAGTVNFSALGNLTINQNGNTLSFSAGNNFKWFGVSTAGLGSTGNVTGLGLGSVVLSGLGNVVLSQSTNANGATINISAAGGGATLRQFEPIPMLTNNTVSLLPSMGSWYVQPMVLPQAIGSGRINQLYSMGGTASLLQFSNGASWASNTTGGRSLSFVLSRTMAIYVQGTGASSTRLESLWANTWGASISQSIGVSTTNASQLTVANQASFQLISNIGTDGAYTTAGFGVTHNASFASSNTNTSVATSGYSSAYNVLSGAIVLPMGFNASLSAGNYWLAYAYSITSTTAGTSALSLAVWPMTSQWGITFMSSNTNRLFGNTISSSVSQLIQGLGRFTIASATNPVTMAFTDVRSVAGTNVIPYYNIIQSNAN